MWSDDDKSLILKRRSNKITCSSSFFLAFSIYMLCMYVRTNVWAYIRAQRKKMRRKKTDKWKGTGIVSPLTSFARALVHMIDTIRTYRVEKKMKKEINNNNITVREYEGKNLSRVIIWFFRSIKLSYTYWQRKKNGVFIFSLQLYQ
jgi:capsule polysaccharide export protein KpsE/RkpR